MGYSLKGKLIQKYPEIGTLHKLDTFKNTSVCVEYKELEQPFAPIHYLAPVFSAGVISSLQGVCLLV
jgi:hypothetical protein